MLQSIESQRVVHDWATEQQQCFLIQIALKCGEGDAEGLQTDENETYLESINSDSMIDKSIPFPISDSQVMPNKVSLDQLVFLIL